MNENIKFLTIKIFVFSLLFGGGVIGILLLPFFSWAVTVTPSVTIVTLPAPTNLTATAISSSQIDLNWDSVTGAVSYNVYRDGNLIDSSATNSYSDTGLSPSTAYTYTVTAVDSNGIESAHSSPASATTLAAPVAPKEEGGALPIFPSPPEVTPESLIINNGDIYTNSLDVNLTLWAEGAFQMAVSNIFDFSDSIWEKYQTQKEWKLAKGDGEKTVYAKFRSPDGGVSQVVSDSIILDTIPPINVSNFEAIAGDKQIILKWENPPDRDFEGVRITGSTEFFPSSPSDGILVYDGKGTSFTAVGLTNGVRYYYTAFAHDKAGNFSSGAVVSATPFREEVPPPPPPPPEEITAEKECQEDGYYWYDDACHKEPKAVFPPPPEIEKLALEDFDFWQEGRKILPKEARIEAKAQEPLTVYIDYEKVPEVLKTIMVTLVKEEKSFSFLLRIDSQKTKYEAVLLAPDEAGLYELIITVLDYKNQTLKVISGYLEIEKPELPPAPAPELPWYRQVKFWFYLLLGIIIIAVIGYLARKIRMKKLESSY